jgi:lipoprotein Spr
MIKKIFFGLFFIFNFVAVYAQNKQENKTEDPDNLASQYLSQIMGVALNVTSNVKLYQFVYDWIGTPYRFGGSSRKGIDCSGFTKEIYAKVFNTIIRRNSRDIFNAAIPISREDLKEGDLVFFKIKSKYITHVGIYLGNNRFAHASSVRGVALNNLEEPYYKRYFYKGGRISELLQP